MISISEYNIVSDHFDNFKHMEKELEQRKLNQCNERQEGGEGRKEPSRNCGK